MAKDEQLIEVQKRLIKNITWPAGPPAPPGGVLALPSRVTRATAHEATDGPPATAWSLRRMPGH